MFWERFEKLCEENGSKPNPVAEKIGIGSATLTKWKNGTIPKGETLIKIADYLNVPVDYLLGRTDDPNQKPGESNIKLDEFSYAMYNESKELSDSDKQRLLTFARMLRESSGEANDN